MLTSIKLRFTARRVPGGLLLLRDRATGGHGHARLLKFGQRALDFAKLPGFLLSGGRANGQLKKTVDSPLFLILVKKLLSLTTYLAD